MTKYERVNREPNSPQPEVATELVTTTAVKPIADINAVNGAITACGFIPSGRCGKRLVLYAIPGTSPKWSKLARLVVLQSDAASMDFAAGMVLAAKVGKSYSEFRRLTNCKSDDSNMFGSAPGHNPTWGRIRAHNRQYPLVVVFDGVTLKPPTRGANGKSLVSDAASVASLLELATNDE